MNEPTHETDAQQLTADTFEVEMTPKFIDDSYGREVLIAVMEIFEPEHLSSTEDPEVLLGNILERVLQQRVENDITFTIAEREIGADEPVHPTIAA